MDLETRVTNLENMLASVIENISNNKYYTDADIAGCRHTDSGLNESKMDKTSISANGEVLGSAASQTYEAGDTFTADNGQLYKALTRIWQGSILAENGNCEKTSITAEIAKNKEEEI